MGWYDFSSVELDYLEKAKTTYVMEAVAHHPVDKVWQAIADTENWHQWFPGVVKAHFGDSPKPYGVGARRYALVGKARYEETILAWEEKQRFAYRIDRATVPIAYAQLESTELFVCEEGTRLVWRLACDRRLLLYLMAPFFHRYLQSLWNKVAANLDIYLE